MSLKEKYQKEVVPQMMEKFGYKNVMAVPRIKKIVLNSCFGKEVVNKTGQEREKISQNVCQDLIAISGQKPKIVKAKKSVSGFKLRSGIVIAATVNLRKNKMYDFLERLIYLTLPRLRDFRGINKKSIDERGNLTIGFKESIAFPEIVAEKEKTIFGLEITITTNAKSKEEGLRLFELMGFPLKKEDKNPPR
ncbi:50S ribosomal protein L5 [Patescibacteria group bacterium]|nr:50S ribosomal protein L5 [Patescibacteria group bacterium]